MTTPNQGNNVSVFDLIEGLTTVDPSELADFEQAMNEEVIPEIVKVVDERRMAAATTREWPLTF